MNKSERVRGGTWISYFSNSDVNFHPFSSVYKLTDFHLKVPESNQVKTNTNNFQTYTFLLLFPCCDIICITSLVYISKMLCNFSLNIIDNTVTEF